MESQKIYLAGNSGNGGYDANAALWASMMNGGGGFGGGNGAWWLLFLLLFARGGYGFGGDGNIQSQLANDRANDWVLQGLNGNRNAIESLASTLNCDIKAVQNTLCTIASQIQNVAAKTELTGAQIINSIQAGNSQLMSMLAQCCCDLKGIMTEGFSTLGYAFRDQTCTLKEAIAASTAQILEGQRAAEMRELQDKLDALREKNSQQAAILNNAQQTAQFQAMLAPIAEDVASIKCKLPKTETIPVSNDYVRIDRSISEPYSRCGCGFFGAGYGFPFGFGFNNAF